MKLTDVSWRARIGIGRPVKILRKLKVLICGRLFNKSLCLFKNHRRLSVIFLLLVIGGVELNPGPTSVRDVCHNTLSNVIKGLKGRKNAREATSVWGQSSQIILGKNTIKTRQFLSNLDKIFSETNDEKYGSTSLAQLVEGISLIEDVRSLSLNLMASKSVWGTLSSHFYTTNSVSDRKFLGSLWKIGNEVESLPKLQPDLDITTTTVKLTEERRKRLHERSRSRKSKKKSGKKRNLSLAKSSDESDSDASSDNDLDENEALGKLIREYNDSIYQFTESFCEVCDKRIYKSLLKRLKLTECIKAKFYDINKEIVFSSDRIVCCSRCYLSLQRPNPKVPSVAKCNNLDLHPMPKEISGMSQAELGLIKQVRAYMKIYLLCRGRGQKAMRGLTVHFPLQVQEVVNCLPNASTLDDVIVLNEQMGESGEPQEIRVRPKKVVEAIRWLKLNNPLYASINIDYNFEFMQFSRVTMKDACDGDFETEMLTNTKVSFISIGEGQEILRCSINQQSPIFSNNAGKQCTAMAASFLAHCFKDSPQTWTTEIADRLLISGNSHYSNKRNETDDFLNSDDVQGVIKVFDTFDIQLSVISNHLFELQGYLKAFAGIDCLRLPDILRRFIDLGYNYGILTCNQYSMALFISENYLYYFDSHSRGKKGCKAANGKACIIKYEISIAPCKIAYVVNRNCMPGNPLKADISDYVFTLTPFRVTDANEIDAIVETPARLLSNQRSEDNEDEESSYSSDDCSSDSDDDSNEIINIPFGKTEATDCVIDRIDILEPNIEEVLDQVRLQREKGKPLNEYFEKFLDVLSFPHLFPDGKNGLNEFRKINITPLDFYQQRLMSRDIRFSGNAEFLFYGLSDCDKFRARQKIAVCCSMKKQGDIFSDTNVIEELGIRDPHIYMSSIRGSASYWKKYLGDLICMVKTLGIPTFFLTVSFDDLNSNDCVNAIFKAEHGYDSPDVDPSTIPFEERRELLNKHPITAARHFSMRLTKFLHFISKNSKSIFGLQLTDYSVRVEFQSRGSPHAHMLLWLQGAPDFKSEEGVRFLEKNVSCSLSSNIRDLVLRYQRHSHTHTCNKHNDGQCRFAFPKPPTHETVILDDEEIFRNKGRAFALKRTKEEEMINHYHPKLLPILKCNMDIQPVTSGTAIAYYIAKYISKSEPSEISSDVQDAIKTINESNLPIRQKMLRIANTIMRKRQVSAQEAAFRICHLFLRYSTRSTVFIPAFRKDNRIRMLNREKFANGVSEFHLNIIDRYMHRPTVLESLCLYEFAARFCVYRRKIDESVDDEDVQEFMEEPDEEIRGKKHIYNLMNNKGQMFERTRSAVVKFPNFHPVSDQDSYYYCILLLYYPFRDETFCDSISPIQFFKSNHGRMRTNKDSALINVELATEIDRALLRISNFNDEERESADIGNEYEADYIPEDLQDEVEPGLEDIFPPAENGNVTETIRKLHSGLNREQKLLFDSIHSHLQPENHSSQVLKFISGAGGVGKSHMIHLLSMLIRNTLCQDSLLIAALSGKAAHLVGGSTLHRTFSLSIEFDRVGEYHKLGSKKLAQLRGAYKNVKYIILDEVSMINYESFNMIHNRLCEIFETDELFGGRSVLLFGDLMQLNPPRGSPVYKQPKRFKACIDLWRQFEFMELTQNMRQIGNEPLLDICNRLRFGDLTTNDIEILQTRIISANKPNFSEMEREFEDSVRIVPTISMCNKYNKIGTKLLKSMVYKIKAFDTYGDGKNFGEEVDEQFVPKKENKTAGLPNSIHLGIGSRVMLRRNLNVRRGLVNGATGQCVGFIWSINHNGPVREGELPKAVLIKFDHIDEVETISCSTVDYYARNHRRVIRRMLPLILAFAVSIHKFQGSTVNKCVIDLGPSLFTKGQAYVALSRCRTLKGIAIVNLDVSKLIKTDKYSPANESAREEMERLRLSQVTNFATRMYI